MPSLRQSSGSRFRSAAFPALSLVYLLAIFWLPLLACKMALREAGTAWPTLALLCVPSSTPYPSHLFGLVEHSTPERNYSRSVPANRLE